MPARTIKHGFDARESIIRGVNTLVQAVTATYGPGGRTVILDRFAGLLSTKDGVTVAREVDLEDHVENIGAKVLREACIKVNDDAGDGTTTAALLAGSILKEGHRLVVSGVCPRKFLEGIRRAAVAAKEALGEIAVPVENQHHLEQVALISCNGDEEVASNMAEACMAVGKNGTVLVEDSHGIETFLEFKEGMELDTGAASTHFLPDESSERVIEGALVAVINKPLVGVEDVQDLMECASQWPDNELLIIAPRIDGAALTTLVMNHTKGVIKSCAVKAPGVPHVQHDYMEDIAVLAAADFVDPDAGYNLQSWDPEWFGSVRKATIGAKTVTFESYPAVADDTQARIEHLKAKIASATSGYDEDRLRERIAKLSGGIAILKVGGITEAALKERRARVEDALGAVRASLKDGLVPGGGSSYLYAAHALAQHPQMEYEEAAGWEAMRRALRHPLRKLAENAGEEGTVIAGDVEAQMSKDPWVGWDTRTRDIRDLSEDPYVVDPCRVAFSVIDAAVSVATALLTVETSVTLLD